MNSLLSLLISGVVFVTVSSGQVSETELNAKQLSQVWERSSLSQSVQLYEEATESRLKANEFDEAVKDLLQAGRISVILEEKSYAKDLFSRSYRISKRSAYLTGRIQSLCELALIEINSGSFERSKKYLDEGKANAESSEDPKAKGSLLFATSEYLYYKRDIPNVISALKKAIEFARQANAGDDEAKYYRSLGYAYLVIEDQKNSLDSINRSLTIWRSLDNKRGTMLSYIALGFALSNYENNQKALEAYTSAEREFPEDIDLMEKASLYNGIGRIYLDYGNWKLSLDYREKALSLFQKGGNNFGVTATLSRIAILTSLISPQNKELVMKKFWIARDFANSVHDDHYRAYVSAEIGSYCFRIHDYENAIGNYRNAFRYFESINDKRVIADISGKLSQVFASQGKVKLARQSLIKALLLNGQIADRFGEAQNLAYLSNLDVFDGNRVDALKNIKRSLELTESLYSDVPNSNLQSTYLSGVYDRYELLIMLLIQSSKGMPEADFAVQGLQVSERSRSRSLLETLRLSEANFLKDAVPESIGEEKELLGKLNARKTKLTELLNSNSGTDEVEKVDDEIRELQRGLEDTKAQLKQDSPIYSAIKNPEPFDVSEFQSKVLDENSVLMEFSLGAEESYLWVVGKAGVDAYVLPSRERIEGRVERLRGLLKAREMRVGEGSEGYQKRVADAEVEYGREARKLSDELLGQAADKIVGKRLIVVADGKLQYFPLGSLPMPNAESDEPILLTNEVVYEPSASALKIIQSSPAAAKPPQKDLLVFADPVFSKDDDRLTGLDTTKTDLTSAFLGLFRSGESIDKLPRLPASNEEAQAISNVIGVSRSTVRSGFEANRDAALSTDITDYKILHFATHGVVDEKRPELSGIVLSMYGQDGKRNDGGFIRLQDVYGMNLNADLVVLSACDTGVGKDVKGEGLMSLNNAFLQAGAKSVVSSLWKVDDDATKELMTGFYRGLADDNLTTSAALRRAQIKMYNDPRFHSPFYWASFTVEGDFANPPKLAHGFDKHFLFLGILPLLLIAVYLFRRRRA